MNAVIPNDVLDNRYRIIKQLGGGSFGQTYLAEDLKRPFKPTCVVKQLSPYSKDEFTLKTARRFFDLEAQSLEKLGTHSGIPTLLASFEDSKEFFLVQEFIDGEDLHGKLQGFNEIQVINLLYEILEILEFIHSQNVIHRDLKPSNLMRRKKDGKLVIIDFGAVKQIRNQQTIIDTGQKGSTVAIGTPGYMPSEQSNGRPRFNSDIYAVGVIAIQALTGLNPSALERNSDDELVWYHHVGVPIRPELVGILTKMVRDHTSSRYQTVKDVVCDLDLLPNSPRNSHGKVLTTIQNDPKNPRFVENPLSTISQSSNVTHNLNHSTSPLNAGQSALGTLPNSPFPKANQNGMSKIVSKLSTNLWNGKLFWGGLIVLFLSGTAGGFLLYSRWFNPESTYKRADKGLYLLSDFVQTIQLKVEPSPTPSDPSPNPTNPSPPLPSVDKPSQTVDNPPPSVNRPSPQPVQGWEDTPPNNTDNGGI